MVKIQQIIKSTAKKLYDSGEAIYLNASNLSLNNPWTSPVRIQMNAENPESFESVVNSYRYYNCNNETGKYVNFFKETK